MAACGARSLTISPDKESPADGEALEAACRAIAIREPEGRHKAPTQAGRRGKSALTACVTVAEVDYAPIRWETQAAPGDYVAP
jgi:hypothetical protein